MEPAPPQICTARLRPFRQRINRTVMTITDSGNVSMEIMCRYGNQQNNQEITKELVHISPNGREVEVYQSTEGVAAMNGCPIPGQPYKLYTYPDLPVKQMKKYQHAFKFVELVKSRTAKVILVTDTAQCKLMENSGPADFKADFHNGSSVVISKSSVTVTDRAGASLTFDVQSVSSHLSPDTLRLVQHAHMCHQKCLEIERSVSNIHSTGVNSDMFPVTIGSTRSPYQLPNASQEQLGLSEPQESSFTDPPLPPQAQLPWGQNQPWQGHTEHSVHSDSDRGYRDCLNGATGPHQARSTGGSLCSETEMNDLLEGQFTEFSGGSSRGSSVKSMSRSVTPQTGNSISQWSNGGNAQTQAPYHHFSSRTPSVTDANFNNSHIINDQPPHIHCSGTALSNEQFCLQASGVSNFEHFSAVPSCHPHNTGNIPTNIVNSSLSDSSMLPREISHPQSLPGNLLDSSIASNNLAHHDQLGFFTPNKNTLRQQQQQQYFDHLNSLSIDSRERCYQQHQQPRDEHAQLLLEHRQGLVQGQYQTEAPGSSVRRSLFTGLGLDLSQPVSSPVPSSGTESLHHDLLVIQRNPSLDLSDCSDAPGGGSEDDQFPEFPRFNQSQLLDQSASESWLEDFNTSLSISSNIPESAVRLETDFLSPKNSLVLPQQTPVIGNKTIEQTELSNEAGAKSAMISTQGAVPLVTSAAQTPSQRFCQNSASSPPKACCLKALNPSSALHEIPQPTSEPPASRQMNPAASNISGAEQKGFTRSGMSLGLINIPKCHKNDRRNSTSNYARGCNSSSDSSNNSACLDLLSPQPAVPISSLPPQLRHSLDMSASSHYSDSSAPSSSSAGDVVRQLFVPYTGWASLHATGAVWILYNDGTQVGVKSTEPAMIYVDQDGMETRYSNADAVPEIVRLKLEKLPAIVDQLMKAPVSLNLSQHQQTGATHKT